MSENPIQGLVSLERPESSNESQTQPGKPELHSENNLPVDKDEDEPLEEESGEKIKWERLVTKGLICSVKRHYNEIDHPINKNHVWSKIVSEVQALETNITESQCKEKWENLLQAYKVTNDIMNKSEEMENSVQESTQFPYYQEIDDIVKLQASSSLPSVNKVRIIVVKTVAAASTSETNQDVQEISGVESEGDENTNKRKRKREITKKFLEMTKLYYKEKSDYLKKRLKHFDEIHKTKMELMKAKLAIEERKVEALEQLAKLKDDDY